MVQAGVAGPDDPYFCVLIREITVAISGASLASNQRPKYDEVTLAEASFNITGGSDGTVGQNTITSITVGGEELMERPLDFDTDPETTATALLGILSTFEQQGAAPNVAHLTFTNSDPEGSFASVAITTHSGIVEGDLLIAQIGRSVGGLGDFGGKVDPTTDGKITPAETGWNIIFENKFSTRGGLPTPHCVNAGCMMSMYWRIATASYASKVYTWNYDIINSAHAIGCIMVSDKARFQEEEPISVGTESSVALSFIDDCDQAVRKVVIAAPDARTEKSMSLVALCVGEHFLSNANPLGVTWSKQLDEFKGPIPTSLHLQLFSQNSSLTVGKQWELGELVHTNLEPTDSYDADAIVIAAITINPRYNTTPPPLVDPGKGSANFTVTVSGSKVTITADNKDFGEGGETIVVTTTGDLTVSQNNFTLVSTGVAFSESIVSIAGFDGVGQVQNSEDRDEVWVTVKRTINGVTKRYVEFLEGYYDNLLHDQEDAYYADSIITYDGVSTTTITGLSHLEGETVRVWGDGAILPDVVVSNGQVTLETAVKVAQIGLAYNHRLETLKIEGGNPAGTALGKKKRINSITFVLLNSHTLTFGPNDDNKFEKDFRLVSSPMDAGVPLFTGEQFYEFDGGLAPDTRIIVESDDPAPFTLLAMVPEVKVNPSK